MILLLSYAAHGSQTNVDNAISDYDAIISDDAPLKPQSTQPDIALEHMLFEEQAIPPLCYALPGLQCFSEPITFAQTKDQAKLPKTKWTVMVYMAADNDLKIFAARNIRQMAMVGSNQNVSIVVHLDIRLNNNYKVTRRYLIESNKITHLNAYDAATQRMDSGDPKTLISFCEYAITNFPAEKYAIFFWDHGTGIADPERGRILDPSTLFILNKETQKLELDRSVGYLEALEKAYHDTRGVCWDDSTGNYLTNQKLIVALNDICQRVLKGNKFNIIGFDACLMSMLEVANIMKAYAHIMVASQEVELGTGWNYTDFLIPLTKTDVTEQEFAQAIVTAYNTAYKPVTEDYTLSALDLQHITSIESSINNVATLLKKCISQQINNSVINSIKASRNKLLCTHFDEPSYIDLHHFCNNLLNNVQHFSLQQRPENINLLIDLKQALMSTKTCIDQTVLSHCTGTKLNKARGVSIYFPEQFIFKSYPMTPFAQSYQWLSFLKTYLMY